MLLPESRGNGTNPAYAAKPIGVGLNDWGKKDGDRLAFEDAEAFAKKHFNIVLGRTTRGDVEGKILALWKAVVEKMPDDDEEAEDKDRKKAGAAKKCGCSTSSTEAARPFAASTGRASVRATC